jgi:hypothetical protein
MKTTTRLAKPSNPEKTQRRPSLQRRPAAQLPASAPVIYGLYAITLAALALNIFATLSFLNYTSRLASAAEIDLSPATGKSALKPAWLPSGSDDPLSAPPQPAKPSSQTAPPSTKDKSAPAGNPTKSAQSGASSRTDLDREPEPAPSSKVPVKAATLPD